jgi:hypothetical protein
VLWEAAGAFFVIFAGSALHFVYGWSGNSPVIGLFAPVNESVWEHLKMGFWTLIPFSLVEYAFLGGGVRGFFFSKLAGVLILIAVILGIYYGYMAVLKREILVVDISSFVLGAILCQIIAFRLMSRARVPAWMEALGICGIAVIALLFMVFTYAPPHFPLFMDSNTGTYGAVWKR